MSSLNAQYTSKSLVSGLTIAKPQSVLDFAALLILVAVFFAYATQRKLWDKPDPYYHLWFERPQLKNGAPRSASKATRDIAQRMQEKGKTMVVFWGSQSGTAENLANRLARDIPARFGVGVMSADLSDYDAETIALIPQTSLALFVLSTFGEGDPSDNTQPFWEWMLKTDKEMSSLRYVAFGLGNSNYKYYNKVVDVVTATMEKLGASALMPTQKADDANGSTEEDFMSWRDDLFAFFKASLELQEKEALYQPTISAELVETSDAAVSVGQPIAQKATAGVSATKHLRIKHSRELFTSSTRNCIHLDLDISDEPELRYKTGDHMAVYPVNPDEEVEIILNILGLTDLRTAAVLVASLDAATKLRVPEKSTVEGLFRHHLEICAPLSRDTLRSLEQFAPSDAARRYLKSISGDKTAFGGLQSHTYLTFGRLLKLAACSAASAGAWRKLPLSFIIETLPSTQPRYYSISSSSVTSPRQPTITALVSKTALACSPDTFVHGITSNYIRALHESSTQSAAGIASDCPAYQTEHANGETRLFAQIRRSKFKLPAQPTTPIIMICAGTGIAPFRAFIEERARFAKIGREVGQMLFFFGCRRPEEDFIYREELEEHQRMLGEGKLRIVTAFSRIDKVYVQDRVRKDVPRVLSLLEEGAHAYICGRAAMAREVGFVLQAAMKEAKDYSDAEVSEWSEGLKRQRMWQEDVWG